MKAFEYLVIGSGCSGAMAAQTLVEAGLNVTMLDAGFTKDPDSSAIPDQDFLSLRQSDTTQHTYLIGPQAEGVAWGKVGKGEQITPPRKHIAKQVDDLIPIDSADFSPLESLAYGGLGVGWGLQCWPFSTYDLKQAGLKPVMFDAYETIAKRIGVSATADKAAGYTLGKLKTYQPSADMDRNHTYIMRKYLADAKGFKRQGFIMGRTPLALITQDYNGRTGYQYRDMDFYSDNDRSAWRPWITIDALKQHKNFQYISGYLVLSFSETPHGVEVECLSTKDNTRRTIVCNKLILATSALGSARIVLRSLGSEATRLPLLCNPYRYVPCIQPKLVGKAAETHKLGFTQLSLFLDETHRNQDVSVASLYSYQSLMLFRIIRHAPLDFVDARLLIQYLMSGMVIMGIHHPDKPSSEKYVQLQPTPDTPTKDNLHVSYHLQPDESAEFNRREKKYLKAMRSMGTYGLKRINPGEGASIHYAGTLPFSQKQKDFHLTADGRLHGTRSVYVADSAGFTYLPAKGLTFSLMANAHLVAESVIQNA
jgi:hypothetical protein